jgi:sugar-specific transcriptional regulator TrmB
MDALQLLKKLGMTEYESRAYLSLARLGPSTVREIVLESKLPRNKTYEALQQLENKRKVASLPVFPKKYKILNPEMLKEEVKDLNNSINDFIKLVENPKSSEFKDLFWIIKGKKAIEEKLALHNTKVKKEILACNNLSKPLYSNLRTMREGIKRGMKVKMICSFDKKRTHIYKEWMKVGVSLRVFNKAKFGPLLPRITIFDGETARLTIGEPEVKQEKDYITLWTESKVFAQMLRNHFMNMWLQCKPLKI